MRIRRKWILTTYMAITTSVSSLVNSQSVPYKDVTGEYPLSRSWGSNLSSTNAGTRDDWTEWEHPRCVGTTGHHLPPPPPALCPTALPQCLQTHHSVQLSFRETVGQDPIMVPFWLKEKLVNKKSDEWSRGDVPYSASGGVAVWRSPLSPFFPRHTKFREWLLFLPMAQPLDLFLLPKPSPGCCSGKNSDFSAKS